VRGRGEGGGGSPIDEPQKHCCTAALGKCVRVRRVPRSSLVFTVQNFQCSPRKVPWVDSVRTYTVASVTLFPGNSQL
jgi:hypothetical protein